MSVEYWEITYDRGVSTLAVWYMDPLFALTQCDFAGHTTRVAALQTLATARAEVEGDLTDARAVVRGHLEELDELTSRVPALIGAGLAADDRLRERLARIYAIPRKVSLNRSLRRGREVHALWVDYNAQVAAATPPVAALTLPYKPEDSEESPVTVTAALFDTLVTTTVATADVAREAAQRAVAAAKSDLRAAAKKVDRDNKRWYKAWTRYYLEGTPEGDAARSQVPTEKGTPAPAALEIESLAVEADGTVTITYAAKGGRHATTLELLHRIGAEEDYGHAVPVARPSQTAGPFAPGETVTFVTRAANSRKANVLSTPKEVMIES